MIVVGLHGDSRAGKDTVAKEMALNHEFEWRSFANPLRQILLAINPMIDHDETGIEFHLKDAVDDYGWDWVKKYYPYSVEMMISLGQSVRDYIHEDAWIWNALAEPLPKRLVISDVRQPNEYEAIKALGGEIWKVVRPGTTKRGMDGLLDNREFDVTLYNNNNIDSFREAINREVTHALQDRWH